MNRLCLLGAVFTCLSAISINVCSSLVNGSLLSIDAGSYFSMEISRGIWIDTEILGNTGLVIGTTQSADGSHPGAPDGSETPGIDQPWEFFGNTGMHQTVLPTDVLNDNGTGQVEIDFSGWSFHWNGANYSSQGAGYLGSNTIAMLSCLASCDVGERYALDFVTDFPFWILDTGNLSPLPYQLHLVGTIIALPLPAAFWVFGSGLLSLIGISRRNRVCRPA